jgi:hypothetical protein
MVLGIVPCAAARAEPARWRAEGWRTDFSKHTVPLTEILDGGPPRDGIPSIDAPRFMPASGITDIAAREPVIVFPLGPRPRAYPLRVLIWHEIVNDIVDGVPVAVTYCPLCNSAIVFDRRIDGRTLEFGTTGKLRHSDLVMYDRESESWWQQFSGEAIVGMHAGRSLRFLPSRIASFGEYRGMAAAGDVLVPVDPSARRYGFNPYVGYDSRDRPYGLFQGHLPQGLPAMTRVVLARQAGGEMAVDMRLLVERKQVQHQGLTFSWTAGTASALDGSGIAASRDVGAITVVTSDGSAVVHDVTFAFALFAFLPTVPVLTADGLVRLTDGTILR